MLHLLLLIELQSWRHFKDCGLSPPARRRSPPAAAWMFPGSGPRGRTWSGRLPPPPPPPAAASRGPNSSSSSSNYLFWTRFSPPLTFLAGLSGSGSVPPPSSLLPLLLPSPHSLLPSISPPFLHARVVCVSPPHPDAAIIDPREPPSLSSQPWAPWPSVESRGYLYLFLMR